MRRVSSLLWSTTALTAIIAAASPAIAQDQPAPVDPNATAQTSPATPATNADARKVLRLHAASGRHANRRHRPSPLAAIGAQHQAQQRPDRRRGRRRGHRQAARHHGVRYRRAHSRRPGRRERGEADRVLLRGLDNTYYTTTYNGREIFTAETRSVALQDFPSGAIAALEAFKTSTANLIEPGIAGLVNVRSRRPFDFKGFEVAGSVWGLHPRQAGGWTPNGNILITDRWRVGDGEMGALINFSYTRLHYLDSIMSPRLFRRSGSRTAAARPTGRRSNMTRQPHAAVGQRRAAVAAFTRPRTLCRRAVARFPPRDPGPPFRAAAVGRRDLHQPDRPAGHQSGRERHCHQSASAVKAGRAAPITRPTLISSPLGGS